jgi:flagellar biosynthesis protein FlhF
VSEKDAVNFARSALASQLKVAGNEAEILDQGGVFAVVGPTGAGKTTTVAKLAARFVVRHGAENLALLTTDGYRIGGQEQLRIYGKILGVAVHAVKDAEDLKRTLAELKNRKLILIDTVGLSQRDKSLGDQLSLFENCGTEVKRLLLLNATSHGDTLNDVVKAYRGKGLTGCIISKLDEAATLGAALDVAIRHSLKLFYATNGQRVPEDLLVANAKDLVKMAVEMASEQTGFGEWDAGLLSQVGSGMELGAAHA